MILAGDPKQLPPTILSADKKVKKDRKAGTKPTVQLPNSKVPLPSQVTEEVPQNEGPDSTEEKTTDESDSDVGDDQPKRETPLEASAGSSSKQADKRVRPKKPKPFLRPPRSLETTLFDRLEKMYGPKIKRMLNVQYR